MTLVDEEDQEHITQGPRWDRVMPAVNESIRVIKEKGRGQGGWVKKMLDSYESIAQDLANGGHVRREHIVFWVKGEMWDPKGSSGWDESLVGQNALSDIRQAEEMLMQVKEMRSFLLRPLPEEERANGWNDELVSSMALALDHLAERLAAGEYLSRADFAIWNRALGLDRFIRGGGFRFPGSEPEEISFIKEGPSGGWWEQVRVFDSRLVNVAGLDVMHAEH
jgi:hypothetical protein